MTKRAARPQVKNASQPRETGPRTNTGSDSWKPPYRFPPQPKLIQLLLLVLLHDGATQLLSGVFDTTSLSKQLSIHILVSILEAPLHAIYVQDVLSRKDYWVSHTAGLSVLDLFKLLLLPSIISAFASGLAICITILWLRWAVAFLGTQNDTEVVASLQSWAEIKSTSAVIATFIGVLATWIFLVIPSTVATTLGQAALIPESTPTYVPLQRAGMAHSARSRDLRPPATFASSLSLTIWSWESLTFGRVAAAGTRMLAFAVLSFIVAPATL